MTVKTQPLVQRSHNQAIAYLHKPLRCLKNLQGMVTVEQFLIHAHSLAAQLPSGRHIINLCGNRYLFMVSICAAILRQQVNLLPPNKSRGTQATLANRYDELYVLHDGLADDQGIADHLPSCNIANLTLEGDRFETNWVPDIPLKQLALISFTSGSTGESKPNLKSWETLVVSTQINRRFMLPDDRLYYLLATVPGQHMWGLETSVLMALFSPVCVMDTKPLFPKDIEQQLNALPEPRVLVSAPVHLQAMMSDELHYPDVEVTLCATSPLTTALAQTVEQRLAGTLSEVYGCSEVGSMAIRKTATSDVWQCFDGIHMQHNEQSITIVSAAHLPEMITLQDKLKFIEMSRFHLMGRESDMVDIAGKRGSLAEINRLLSGFKGIDDGVVIFPKQDRPVPRLVALVVFKPLFGVDDLRRYLQAHLDAVFIPRPIFSVDKLPREESGKLPSKRVTALYQRLIAKRV